MKIKDDLSTPTPLWSRSTKSERKSVRRKQNYPTECFQNIRVNFIVETTRLSRFDKMVDQQFTTVSLRDIPYHDLCILDSKNVLILQTCFFFLWTLFRTTHLLWTFKPSCYIIIYPKISDWLGLVPWLNRLIIFCSF